MPYKNYVQIYYMYICLKVEVVIAIYTVFVITYFILYTHTHMCTSSTRPPQNNAVHNLHKIVTILHVYREFTITTNNNKQQSTVLIAI